ncbi:VOC family protein [Actinoplanes sp. NPDC051494]|uniref:VOC family protein n=1 Tax=Actinoplanes sp. NPDC051494 TaxID=3363907 RepID=UPI0037A42A57
MSAGMRWSHVALNCRDVTTTEKFYQEWFGFHRARSVALGDAEIVFLRRGDAYLELFGAGDGAEATGTADGPKEPGTVRHLAFQTDDLDSFLDRAAALPVSLGPLSFDDFLPGWRSVWFTDPDGVVVEVSQGFRDDESLPV